MFIWRNIEGPGGSLPAKQPRALPSNYQQPTTRELLKGVAPKEKVTAATISREVSDQAIENFFTLVRSEYSNLEASVTTEQARSLVPKWKKGYQDQLLAALNIDGPFDTAKLPAEAMKHYFLTLEMMEGFVENSYID